MKDQSYFRIKVGVEVLDDYVKELSQINKSDEDLPQYLKKEVKSFYRSFIRLKRAFKTYERPKTKYLERG